MTKGNDGSGNNVDRDDWETPQWLFDKLDEQYEFLFDCCSSFSNKKCNNFADDFINYPSYIFRRSNCWINPPFSKAKEMIEHFFKVVTKGVGIYRCDNIETQVWSLIFEKADWIFVFNKRICYEGHEGKGARFGSSLFGIGVLPPKNLKGTTLMVKK